LALAEKGLLPAWPVLGVDEVAPAEPVLEEELRQLSGDLVDDWREVAEAPAALRVVLGAPDAVGDRGKNAAQLRLDLAQRLVGHALLADIAGCQQGEGARPHVQPGDADVDRDPDLLVARAEDVAFLRVEDAGMAGGAAQPLVAGRLVKAEQF